MINTNKTYILFLLILGVASLFMSCAKESTGKLSSEFLPVEGSPLVGFRVLLHIGAAHDPIGSPHFQHARQWRKQEFDLQGDHRKVLSYRWGYKAHG
jgi:hypothetical protein